MGDVMSGTKSMTTQLILYVHLGVKGLNLASYSNFPAPVHNNEHQNNKKKTFNLIEVYETAI